MDVNTEQWTKSRGDSATGLNSLAAAYAWILSHVWGVSIADRHGAPPLAGLASS